MDRIDAMDTSLRLAPALARRRVEARDSSIRLAARATLMCRLPVGACIAVQAGRVWLTQAGDANDYFIGAGERHVVTRATQVVIEGDAALTLLRVHADGPVAARPGFP